MNILITGCNGQLVNEIKRLETLYPNHNWINTDVAELDITDEDAVAAFVHTNEIDGIINCAAYTAVDKAEENEAFCSKLNAEAPAFLAAAVDARDGFIIQISTDYVFDGTNHIPYVETDDTCPNSVYGKTKLVGEFNVLKLCRRAIVIRTAWLYSSFGNNFVKTMLRLGQEKSQLGVIFDQIGTPTYAHDLAQAILTIIEKGILPGTYHFTNEGVCSWYDFTKTIHDLAGITTCHVNPLHTAEYPTPAKRPFYSVLDKTKIKETYGISIPHWKDSLSRCLKEMAL